MIEVLNRLRVRIAFLFVVAPLHLGGCATIFTGTTDTLKFESNAPGVRLTIDGRYRGELPLTLEMSRGFVGGQQFIARFEREGYVTQEFKLNRQFNAVAILDVSSTLVSGGVDVLTGSLVKFSPREYHVHMLTAGGRAGSSGFQRSVELYRFALTNYHGIQKDIARGGGEYLATFAAMVGGDEGTARLIAEEATLGAPALLSASSAHVFVERFNRMLAASPLLTPHQL